MCGREEVLFTGPEKGPKYSTPIKWERRHQIEGGNEPVDQHSVLERCNYHWTQCQTPSQEKASPKSCCENIAHCGTPCSNLQFGLGVRDVLSELSNSSKDKEHYANYWNSISLRDIRVPKLMEQNRREENERR